MTRTPEIARAYVLAEEIERLRKVDADTRDAEQLYIAYLRENRAALEPQLPGERDLFYTYPLRWDDIKRLADSDLHYYLDAVRELSFEGWSGDQLPPEFFLMRNIVTACLSGTDFESIAGNYAALSRLEELVAEEVWTLRFLDDPSVADAPAIKRVYVNACALEVFPRQLYKAATLEQLCISYCRTREDLLYPFHAIPSGISQLKRLKRLDLAGIGLTNVPLELFEMPWLESVNLLSSDIPEAEQVRLRAALPNAKILFDET